MDKQLLVKGITAIAFGIAGSIVFTPIFIFLRKMFYGPTQKKKLLDKAIEKGHYVTAKLKREYDIKNDDFTDSGKVIGIYEYEYNGKKYKTRGRGINHCPETIELYFINNPKKVGTVDDLYITAHSPWLKSFMVIGIICWILGFVLLIKYY